MVRELVPPSGNGRTGEIAGSRTGHDHGAVAQPRTSLLARPTVTPRKREFSWIDHCHRVTPFTR
jgi:hypothetical protein